jgi:hypothetical protein
MAAGARWPLPNRSGSFNYGRFAAAAAAEIRSGSGVTSDRDRKRPANLMHLPWLEMADEPDQARLFHRLDVVQIHGGYVLDSLLHPHENFAGGATN